QEFHSLALGRFELREPSAMPPHLDVAQPLDTVADVLDSRSQVESVEPLEKRFELEVDNLLGLFRFALAIAERAIHQRAEIVDVVQVNVLHRVQALVEIARHPHIEKKQRVVALLAASRYESLGAEPWSLRGDRADQHVNH